MTNSITTSRITALAVLAVALAVPATSQAATSFGAKLDPTVQPSNSLPAHECSTPGSCTRVLNDAYGDPGNETAPKKGTIKKITLIAGGPGSFKLQATTVQGSGDAREAKVTAQSKTINYAGQPDSFDEPYNVETFKVDVPVKKGQYLGVRGDTTSMVRCSSGGDNTLEFQPALVKGDPFSTITGDDGCWLLLGATVK